MKVITEKIQILVIETEDPEIALESIDATTDFGFDPLNSADRLKPNARYFLKETRIEKQKVTTGLSSESLSWLSDYFQSDGGFGHD